MCSYGQTNTTHLAKQNTYWSDQKRIWRNTDLVRNNKGLLLNAFPYTKHWIDKECTGRVLCLFVSPLTHNYCNVYLLEF